MTDTFQFCTFHVGDLFFGIGVHEVQEVIRYQEMTRVPLAPSVVRGLINLRGQIVTAVDLRRRLGVDTENGELPMNVVVSTQGGAVSLLVDEIGDVLQISDEMLEPPPQTISGPTRELVRSVSKLEGRLLLILDTRKAVSLGGESLSND